MAYYRTLKNGDRRLVFTAKDKAVQDQRKRNQWENQPGIFATRNYTRSSSKLLSRKRIREQIRYMWMFHHGIDECDQAIKEKQNLITFWRSRIHADLRYKKTGIYTAQCSCAGINDARAMLNMIQADLKFWEMVKRHYYSWA
jgi:hypothetical protein